MFKIERKFIVRKCTSLSFNILFIFNFSTCVFVNFYQKNCLYCYTQFNYQQKSLFINFRLRNKCVCYNMVNKICTEFHYFIVVIILHILELIKRLFKANTCMFCIQGQSLQRHKSTTKLFNVQC